MTRDSAEYVHFLAWTLLINVVVFAGYIAVDQSYLQTMFRADRSHLTVLIALVFVGGTLYAAWHIFVTARLLREARSHLSGNAPAGSASFVGRFIEETGAARKPAPGRDGMPILEIYADELRHPVEIGNHIVDILIRLGLIGTIIGFILMLQTLVEGPLPQADSIQKLLVTMSGGMGTALYTTLAGLVTASLLGLQLQLLGRGVEQLIAALIRIHEHRS
ncbi:MAG: MotA/TolQ/ExbB proton channel family protein [Methyloligellaceae bacterium]